MIQSIGTGSVTGTSLSAAHAASSPTGQAVAAMTTVSNRVATTVLRELHPGQGGGGRARHGGGAGDPYDVMGVAEQLSSSLGGTPADTGRIGRALGELASEVASAVAAKPNSNVVGLVNHTIVKLTDSDGRPGATDTDQAVSAINWAVVNLREEPFHLPANIEARRPLDL